MAAICILQMLASACGPPYRVKYGFRGNSQSAGGWRFSSWLDCYQPKNVPDSLLKFDFRYILEADGGPKKIRDALRIDSINVFREDEVNGQLTLIWSKSDIEMEPTHFGFEGEWHCGRLDPTIKKLKWHVYLTFVSEGNLSTQQSILEFAESRSRRSQAWLQ